MQTKGEIWLLQIIKKEQGERERDRRIGVQSEGEMAERVREREMVVRERKTHGERDGE